MHSFFYQTVETVQGDLTDIVRASGSGSGDARAFDNHNFVPPSDLPDSYNFDVNPMTSSQELTSAKAYPVATRPIKPTPRFLPLVSSSSTIGGKRRKGQAKKVICVPAPTVDKESSKGSVVVPSDLWAWRKYGQKPIKGSPYPRGYYRCSSSKGCLARKQVERSTSDPTMLVITYTAEHNHPWPTQRNSLAGSSRSRNYTTRKSATESPTPTADHFETKDTVDSSSPLEVIKDGDKYEFEQVFNHSNYETTSMIESESFTDFFGELGGLEADPVSLIFPSREELLGDKLGETTKALDPLNLFDWDGN